MYAVQRIHAPCLFVKLPPKCGEKQGEIKCQKKRKILELFRKVWYNRKE